MPTPSTARMHDFEVVSNQEIADGIFSLVISAPKLASALKPGQFVNIAVPGDASSLLRVPLSFYRADAEAGTVELWYAVVGDDTRRLSQMGPGSKSNLLGPGGHGWLVPEGTRKALLVAGGIGVPPVLCLAGMLAEQGVDVDCAWALAPLPRPWVSMSSARWAPRLTCAPTMARWARTVFAPTRQPSCSARAATTMWPAAAPLS